jgi:hypothetical protein
MICFLMASDLWDAAVTLFLSIGYVATRQYIERCSFPFLTEGWSPKAEAVG